MRKIQKPGKQQLKTEAEWIWRKNYRLWDANRKIFLYPENWILAIANRTNIDKALMRRFHFVIRIPQRRNLRHKESFTC
jgi:hypothetical protein